MHAFPVNCSTLLPLCGVGADTISCRVCLVCFDNHCICTMCGVVFMAGFAARYHATEEQYPHYYFYIFHSIAILDEMNIE